MSNNLEMALATKNQYILSLPPTNESALLYFEKDQIKSFVAEELGLQQESYILTSYKRAKGLLINDCLLGS